MIHSPIFLRASLFCLGLALAACSKEVGVPEDANADSDQDGLTDLIERELGTSPTLDDTDGDGFSDFFELNDQGFSPQLNNYRFNPLIADVPKVEVTVVSPPIVHIIHTLSDSSTKSFENSTSDEVSEGFRTTNTSGSSLRTELSISETVGVEATWGAMPGTSVNASVSVSASVAQEQNFSYSNEHSTENRRTLAQSEGFTDSNEVTRSGGEIEMLVDVANTGHVAFQVDTLSLGITKQDAATGQTVEVGGLEFDTGRTFQAIGALPPGSAQKGMVFRRGDLNLDKTEALLRPGAIAVRSFHNLSDELGTSYAFRFTNIASRTATVEIDYGDQRAPETYHPATYTDDGRGLSLETLLTRRLRLPIETGTILWTYPTGTDDTRFGITQVREVAADSRSGAYWVIELERAGNGDTVVQRFNPLQRAVDLAGLRVQSTDVVRLIYVIDQDRDGLGTRAEFAFGTDPELYDTDGDGRSDGEEVMGRSDPLSGAAYTSLVAAHDRYLTVTLEFEHTPDESGATETLTFDWGDGTPPLLRRQVMNDRLTLTHDYTQPGTYTLRTTLKPANSDRARVETRTLTLHPVLREVWRTSLPDGHADLAMTADGGVYVHTAQWDTAGITLRLAALSPAGEVRWERAFADYPSEQTSGNGRRRRLAPSLRWAPGYGSERLALAPDGTVYASALNHLYAFDDNGTQQWRDTLSDGPLPLAATALAINDAGALAVAGQHIDFYRDARNVTGRLAAQLKRFEGDIDPKRNFRFWAFQYYRANFLSRPGAKFSRLGQLTEKGAFASAWQADDTLVLLRCNDYHSAFARCEKPKLEWAGSDGKSSVFPLDQTHRARLSVRNNRAVVMSSYRRDSFRPTDGMPEAGKRLGELADYAWSATSYHRDGTREWSAGPSGTIMSKVGDLQLLPDGDTVITSVGYIPDPGQSIGDLQQRLADAIRTGENLGRPRSAMLYERYDRNGALTQRGVIQLGGLFYDANPENPLPALPLAVRGNRLTTAWRQAEGDKMVVMVKQLRIVSKTLEISAPNSSSVSK